MTRRPRSLDDEDPVLVNGDFENGCWVSKPSRAVSRAVNARLLSQTAKF